MTGLSLGQQQLLSLIPLYFRGLASDCCLPGAPTLYPLPLQVYPEVKDSNQACLPPSSFITCSSDNTIRLWNTESSGVHGSTLHRNILSNVSLRPSMLSACVSLPSCSFSGTGSPGLTSEFLCRLPLRVRALSCPAFLSSCRCTDQTVLPTSDLLHQDLIKIIYVDGNTQALLDTELPGGDKADGSLMDPRVGIRSVCISPNGQHLASGDRVGTLR